MAATRDSPEVSNLAEGPGIKFSQQQNKNPLFSGYTVSSSSSQQKQTTTTTETALTNQNFMSPTTTTTMSNMPPPTVYGELSILGYNGYIPTVEKNGRRSKSKFLLCKRPEPNGIKKSKHYIVKQQPQTAKAIQDKDLHSISYTFSRSQTIIVEYRQDENTDMFQIGRSSEDPIDFVVMDTLSINLVDSSSSNRQHNHHHRSSRHNHCENNSSGDQHASQLDGNDMQRFHRHLVKVSEEMLQHFGTPPPAHDQRGRLHYLRNHQSQAILIDYPQPNMSNLPPMVADLLRNHESSIFLQNQHGHHHHHHHNHHHQQQQPNQHGHSSNTSQQQPPVRNLISGHHHQASSHNNLGAGSAQNDASLRHNLISKRSHATQSTISRFACRILVDRKPPYTARIYAAGFDSSKNIFLGEKATKWEHNNTIDGLTTNGVLLMHPKSQVNEGSDELKHTSHNELKDDKSKSGDISESKQHCSNDGLEEDALGFGNNSNNNNNNSNNNNNNNNCSGSSEQTKETSTSDSKQFENMSQSRQTGDNMYDDVNSKLKDPAHEIGGVWREVSVDGGIYAIRESRSAPQKGTRIENESNVLQDGTLIDLCGATLLWRSVDGFKASPTKKSLEEKIDMLNASRPQCPVGLNTLVIPRKPIIPSNQHHRSSHKDHHGKDIDKNSHQPYVYLKCGHVQGYHDWGTTEKLNQRTCPICLSVGYVARLSMGLEPSFYVDSGPLTHVFNPCGHMASDRTVKYWCSIKIPHGTHFFHSICPFCATPLATNEPAFTRLIFQDDLD